MKQNIILIIRALFFMLLFFKPNCINAKEHKDSLCLPYFVKDGEKYFLHSSLSSHNLELELSDYIKRKLSIARYDCTSFRFFIKMTINKSGRVKKIKLLNIKSFKNNMIAWREVKDIICNMEFYPATRGKPINFTLKFYVRLKFY